AAQRYGLSISVPGVATLRRNQISIDTAVLTRSDQWPNLAEMSGGELLLVGNLQWNDGALGWVATWSFKASGNRHRWSVRGVNYDEAFRNAVRGAARGLSGNGEPLWSVAFALVRRSSGVSPSPRCQRELRVCRGRPPPKASLRGEYLRAFRRKSQERHLHS